MGIAPRSGHLPFPSRNRGDQPGRHPHLAPEIQLFYKAKQPRPKDEADFAAVLPFLTQERRRWLSEALAHSFGAHPWQDQLAC